MMVSKKLAAILTAFVMLLLPAQTAFASGRYPALNSGESVEVANGDGTKTYFVLDPLAAGQAAFNADAEWWRLVYDAVRGEVQKLAPDKYHARTEDIILLLHNRPMDNLKTASLRYRLGDGQIGLADKLKEGEVLRVAPRLFPALERELDYTVEGWFYWVQNGVFDLMALACRDPGEITIHELAHAFTVYETSTEERERIASRVVESLTQNESFMGAFSASSLTPHLSAPVEVPYAY